MSVLAEVYRLPLGLLTDFYQLTMAQGYRRAGLAEVEGVFHLFFRKSPFGGGFAVACGLSRVLEFLEGFRFGDEDLAYLARQAGNDGEPLFEPSFLEELRSLRLECDVDAIPEGTVVFPFEPLVRVRGPLLQAQLLETALLNFVNFETLIATKMAFDSEEEAFEAWARAQPNNSVFLVDTYDTLEGVRRAAAAARRLRERGQRAIGIRLDSGDLAYLSIAARAILDEASLSEVKIVASNELDEHLIASLKEQGARIDVWGVGTRLVTGGDQAALGGVYKLGAVREAGGPWRTRVKVSEQAVKTSNPGVQQVRRFSGPDGFAADVIYDEERGLGEAPTLVDPLDPTHRKRVPAGSGFEDLLVPVVRGGRVVYQPPSLPATQARAKEQVARLHPGIRRFVNPHQYPVGLALELYELKTRLVLEARGALLHSA